jgi:putative transposase
MYIQCLDMSKQLIYRKEQGRIIAQMNGSVERISDKSYTVSSHSGNGSYNVNATEIGWNCSCPDHVYRGLKCKHVYAGEISFAIRKQVEVTKIESIQINCCIFCSSPNIVKDGLT